MSQEGKKSFLEGGEGGINIIFGLKYRPLKEGNELLVIHYFILSVTVPLQLLVTAI
jgi:hypothetical protein